MPSVQVNNGSLFYPIQFIRESFWMRSSSFFFPHSTSFESFWRSSCPWVIFWIEYSKANGIVVNSGELKFIIPNPINFSKISNKFKNVCSLANEIKSIRVNRCYFRLIEITSIKSNTFESYRMSSCSIVLFWTKSR